MSISVKINTKHGCSNRHTEKTKQTLLEIKCYIEQQQQKIKIVQCKIKSKSQTKMKKYKSKVHWNHTETLDNKQVYKTPKKLKPWEHVREHNKLFYFTHLPTN